MTITNEWMCPNCGDTITLSGATEGWKCAVCGEEMQPRSQTDVTPNAELRKLASEWEARGKGTDIAEVCAKELRELIGDE